MAEFNSNAMTSVNGGVQTGVIFSPFVNSRHTETSTILKAFGGSSPNEMFLGMFKIFNQVQLTSSSLISFSDLQKNTIYTKGFNAGLNFAIPYEIGLPVISENLVGNIEKVGLGLSKFPIVLNDDCYSEGDILRYSKMSGKQIILLDNGVPHGSNTKYTVQLASDDEEDFMPQEALQPGIPYMKIGNPAGEFDTNKSSLTNKGRHGLMNYRYVTGDSTEFIQHWITGHADQLSVDAGMQNQNFTPFQHLTDLSANNSIMNFYQSDMQGKVKSKFWMPTIVARMGMELQDTMVKKLMYGQQFTIQGRSKKNTRVSAGYIDQVKNRGHYHTYNNPKKLLGLLKEAIATLYQNRPDIPTRDRKVKFKMGSGAMFVMQQEFMEQFKMNPFITMSDHPALKGMITGDVDNIHYKQIQVTGALYPEVGNIEFELDTSLDFIDMDNPFAKTLGQYKHSSYMVFVEDLTSMTDSNFMPSSGFNVKEGFNKGSNVVMIKPENFTDNMSFGVGYGCLPTLAQFAGVNPHNHSINAQGFEVVMQTAGELFILDPTRIFLLEYVPEEFRIG